MPALGVGAHAEKVEELSGACVHRVDVLPNSLTQQLPEHVLRHACRYVAVERTSSIGLMSAVTAAMAPPTSPLASAASARDARSGTSATEPMATRAGWRQTA